jgi:hypothetical protein
MRPSRESDEEVVMLNECNHKEWKQNLKLLIIRKKGKSEKAIFAYITRR